MKKILLAETDEDITRCFPVMAELRQHLVESEFLGRVRRQQLSGYRLAFLELDEVVACVAGFRVSECLAWGRFLYVDDLVTAAQHRFKGAGQIMMDWLLEHARTEGCQELHLDSGVQRFEAHGFYLKNRLHIKSLHFSRVMT